MHILYLQQLLVLPGNPGTQRSWEMAQTWKEAGHKVSFISSTALLGKEESNQFYYTQKLEGIDLHLLDIPYSHFMPFRERLKAFYRFYKEAYKLKKVFQEVDIVLAYSAPLSTAFLGRKLAKYLKAPFVFEAADVWPDVPIGMGIVKNPALKFFLQNRTKKLYKSASIICTFTEDMREQIQSHGISENDIQVIHNGVNLSRFGQRNPIATRQLKIVYVGGLGMANGLSQLLYTWKLIEKKWSSNKVSLHIVGEGNEGE
ncbi:MAG: glycosyltransferase, partial [Bacteroidota bacterium]